MRVDGESIRGPNKMKTPYKERNPNLYCRFHRDIGHDTENCWPLKKEIESLIQRGKLGRFIKHGRNADRDNDNRIGRRNGERQPWRRNDRNDGGRNNANTDNRRKERGRSRERDGRNAGQQDDRPTGVSRDSSTKKSRENNGMISFNESDIDSVSCPHDDALVVNLNMDGYEMKRVMIDTGSSVDLLYYEAFKQMEVPEDRLLPIEGPIKGVTGASAYPFARVNLQVKFGQKPCQIERGIEFLVVKFQGAYNAIIGRATQNALRVVASTYYQAMKFSTPHGIGIVRGQQKIARECYLEETKTLDGTVVLMSSLDVRADEKEQNNEARRAELVLLSKRRG
ncbi:hypothetical protein K2173_028223 [Erythroxylum novogranatense]|uniref:Peptidase A2 domain-containing protein n=1 Tax=Erythroxylum novogranatense TaxID=1862640 RepID=A0AAV8U193_9ROSI|nr:hypothetical protein K2173_028223 [Erythroxylum novogranatense]